MVFRIISCHIPQAYGSIIDIDQISDKFLFLVFVQNELLKI